MEQLCALARFLDSMLAIRRLAEDNSCIQGQTAANADECRTCSGSL